MTILIIGSDSLIGSALERQLKKEGRKIISTTRRKNIISKSKLYLDLSKNAEKFELPQDIEAAVICAGITRLEDCRNDPAGSYMINVVNLGKLIKRLVTKNIFFVYLSSNQVFDGLKPFRMNTDPLSPATQYGIQKAAIEELIRRLTDNFAIVRLTKVFDDNFQLFRNWKRKLGDHSVIHPFSNMYLSPVPVEFVVLCLKLIIDKWSRGIYHVSGEEDVSYAEAAIAYAHSAGIDTKLVQPVAALKDSFEHIPLYTTLNTDCVLSSLNIKAPDLWQTIIRAFDKSDI